MSNLEWAKKELELAGYHESDHEEGPNKWMRDGVLQLLKVFSAQGHSGMSAPHAIHFFERLASLKPLTPLTGDDSEWNDVGDGVWQNNRASTIFKRSDGSAYNIEGVVFWEWHTDEETGEKYKVYFTSSKSRTDVKFPYAVPAEPEYQEAT